MLRPWNAETLYIEIFQCSNALMLICWYADMLKWWNALILKDWNTEYKCWNAEMLILPNFRFANSPKSNRWLKKSGSLYIVVVVIVGFHTGGVGMSKWSKLVSRDWQTFKYAASEFDMSGTHLEHIWDKSWTYLGYIF